MVAARHLGCACYLCGSPAAVRNIPWRPSRAKSHPPGPSACPASYRPRPRTDRPQPIFSLLKVSHRSTSLVPRGTACSPCVSRIARLHRFIDRAVWGQRQIPRHSESGSSSWVWHWRRRGEARRVEWGGRREQLGRGRRCDKDLPLVHLARRAIPSRPAYLV